MATFPWLGVTRLAPDLPPPPRSGRFLSTPGRGLRSGAPDRCPPSWLEGLPFDHDPLRIEDAGWGVIFAGGDRAGVERQIAPLLSHRGDQVPAGRFKVLEYRPGESAKGWLARHGAYPGTIVPGRVPYDLLIVGGPGAVPFEFGAALGLEYAVGRLAFDDPEGYGRYARDLVARETGQGPPQDREIAFWGPRLPGDRASKMSADDLLGRLVEGCPEEDEAPIAAVSGFRSRACLAREATHDRLSRMIHPGPGDRAPSVIVAASHGLEGGDPRAGPGALLTQDQDVFSALDVLDHARVSGLIAVIFACFGAGTRGAAPGEPAAMAALPQRLLGHPLGGASAVLGHVDRAWGYSIRPPGLPPQIAPIRNFLGRVLRGEPVGHAMRDFSLRHAASASALLDRIEAGSSDPRGASLPSERADARDFLLLGDPAARLC